MSLSFPLSLSVNVLNLPLNTSPEALFTPLSDMPWSMWLDSGNSKHIDACFDIFVWQPKATLTTLGTKTHIHYPELNKTIQSEEDPLSLLDTIQHEIITKCIPSDYELPFLGGALGYFAYDLGRRFESLPTQAIKDINVPDMSVGIYSQAIIYDHKQKQYLLICPETERINIEEAIETKLSLANNKSTQQNFSLKSSWQSNINKVSYQNKFNQVQDYLLSGDCYQINLAQRFSAEYQGNEFLAYCALRKENNAPFSAFMRFDNSAILSLSPERFIQLSKGKVQSKPIKGTMPRSKNTEQDKNNANILKQSSKDRAENVMIVDLLRNDISKVCKPNTVKVPTLFDIESFPAVHHLVSTVEGQLLDKYNANDLLREAFPGGSITGAPKIRAMEIIEQLEPHRRSVYCGSVGYISSCGRMDTSITIRTLVCETSHTASTSNKIYCWAGGGLVADSTVDSEYQETYDKVEKILPILSQLTQH